MSLLALSSCGSPTNPSGTKETFKQKTPIVIGIGKSSTQRSLAKFYDDELEKVGRSTKHSSMTPTDRIRALRDGEVQMIVGCVGEFLDLLDPNKGIQMRQMYAEDQEQNAVRWRDIIHSTMMSALPGDLTAGDPGIGEACYDDSIPQNTVAIYRKTWIDRDERKAINNVAGAVSTDMIQDRADSF